MPGDAGGDNNSPPRFVQPLSDVEFVEGVLGRQLFPRDRVQDVDGNTLSFTWSAAPVGGGPFPSWLIFSASDLAFEGTAPPGSPDIVITVTASDGQASSAPEQFTLYTRSSSNAAPRLVQAITDQQWSEGTSGSYQVPSGTFVDPEGQPLTYSALLGSGAPLPAWLRFDATTRTLAGTPPAGSDDLSIRITATDPLRASASADFVLRTPAAGGDPGRISGTTGSDIITGTTAADSISALAGNDVVDAGDGDDLIDGGPGADRLTGGAGIDTAVFPASRGDYLLSRSADGIVTVAEKDGTADTLIAIEQLQFADQRITTSGLAYQPMFTAAPTGSASPVYRFYNARDKAYFYTPSAGERDLVIRESTDAAYTPGQDVWPYYYQGSTFGQPSASTGVAPVYRFYNTQTGHHFFTTSEAERALVIRESTDPTYTPENGLWPFVTEGVGFNAYAAAGAGDAVPVYRFFSPSLNRHFFTASVDEANAIRQTNLWTDEGVGFWAAKLSSNTVPAVARPLADGSWGEGGSAAYQFPADAFVDADGDSLRYTAATPTGGALPAWLSFASDTRTFSGTPPDGSGDITVRLTASDGRGGSAFDDFIIGTPARGSDDYAADSGTTGRAVVNGTVSGIVESSGDRDYFRVTLTAGQAYTIDLEGVGTSLATLTDPVLYGVGTSSGKTAGSVGFYTNTGSNDIGGKNGALNARVGFAPSSTGDYYISAGGQGTATGSYRLTIRSTTIASDDYSGYGGSSPGSVSVGGSVTGNIEYPGDADGFTVNLTSGQTYTIELKGSRTGAGSLADPWLDVIANTSSGYTLTQLQDIDSDSGNRDARLVLTPSGSGTYTIYANSSNGTLGTYALSVSVAGTSANKLPTLSRPLADGSWGEGGSAAYQFPADAFVDADGDSLRYTAATPTGGALPAWLSFASDTRTFSGTPPDGSGDITVRLTASDGRGGSAFDDFIIGTPARGSDDYTAASGTTGRAVVNGTVSGIVESSGDRDYFRVSLTAGQAYTIDLQGVGTSQATLTDPMLFGIGTSNGKASGGVSFYSNTDSDDIGGKNGALNARVGFAPASTGDYYISAGGQGTATGSYRLTIRSTAIGSDDFSSYGGSSQGSVSVGGSVTGNIEYPGDTDAFTVSLTSGQTYTIELKGSGSGSLADPWLEVNGNSGGGWSGLGLGDIDVQNKNARFVITPNGTGGTYTIVAGSSNGTLGTYTLSVNAGSPSSSMAAPSSADVDRNHAGYANDPTGQALEVGLTGLAPVQMLGGGGKADG